MPLFIRTLRKAKEKRLTESKSVVVREGFIWEYEGPFGGGSCVSCHTLGNDIMVITICITWYNVNCTMSLISQ